jgi:branched-chain amino acid transport system permease protein
MAVAAGLALIVDEAIVVPLRRRPSTEPFTYVVATIGVGLILETVLKRLSHSAQRSYPIDGFPTGTVHVGGVLIANLQILILAVTIGVMVILTLSLARTKAGRELRAVAESREVAELLGINSRKGFAMAFAISGVLAALAGMFVAIQQSLVTYDSGDALLLITFSAIVIGGMGSVPGAVVGGLVLGLGQVLVQAYVSANVANVWAFAIMILVLLFRPGGIFAKTVVTRA